jgi:hypothetical protein
MILGKLNNATMRRIGLHQWNAIAATITTTNPAIQKFDEIAAVMRPPSKTPSGIMLKRFRKNAVFASAYQNGSFVKMPAA